MHHPDKQRSRGEPEAVMCRPLIFHRAVVHVRVSMHVMTMLVCVKV